mgnify:FL=1
MGLKRTYSVEITEIRHIDVEVEADNEKDALTKARISYGDGIYKTEGNHIVAAEFEIKNDAYNLN